LNRLLKWTTQQFRAAKIYYGHGTDNAWDEAVALARFVLHFPPDADAAILEKSLTPKQQQAIKKLVQLRIKKRIPVAYLTHEAWFAGLAFYVNQQVLIPRSPLAEIIEQRFQPWSKPKQIRRVLDIGTGSGCIAIACAAHLPWTQVDAVDISKAALQVARRNVREHRLKSRVHLYQSDLFAALKNKKYDVIISNPPYVGAAEMRGLPKEYQHEPRQALQAKQNGLEIVLRILNEAGRHLTKKGILIVEVGNSEMALRKKLPHVPFIWLEFARGGGGVFLLTAEDLAQL
jgi:ribosomal protein L3 glutamine methyltransferase